MVTILGMLAAIASTASVEDRRVLPSTREVTIDCPVQQTTRVVLPERVTGYRGDPTSEALLDLHIETRPYAVISVQPKRHPFEARFRIDGITRRLVLVFRTVADGKPREIRLKLATPTPAHPHSTPARSVTASRVRGPLQTQANSWGQTPVGATPPAIASSPEVVNADKSSQQASTAAPSADRADGFNSAGQGEPPVAAKASLEAPRVPISSGAGVPSQQVAEAARPASGILDPGILTARVRSIGRVENLPGQRPVELIDLLEGHRYLWLRFSVGDAKGVRVERIWWEHGPITTYAVEEMERGKRLAVVVQLPRRTDAGTALVTKRTRVHIKLSDGERKFALSAPWLGAIVKDLFGW